MEFLDRFSTSVYAHIGGLNRCLGSLCMLAGADSHISEGRQFQSCKSVLLYVFPINFRSVHLRQTFIFHGFLRPTLRRSWKTRLGRATCATHAFDPSDVRWMCQARASGILQAQPQPGLVQSVVPKQRPSTSSSEAGTAGCYSRGRSGEYEYVIVCV